MIAFLIFLLLFPISVFALGPSTPVLTGFNGTESPLSEGGNWTGGVLGTGTCDKSSDVAVNSASGTEDCYWTATFGKEQEVYATLPNATNHGDVTNARLFLCLQQIGAGTVDGYAATFRKVTALSDNVRIHRIDNGSYVQLTTADQELDDGDKLWLRRTGSTLTLYVDTGSGWTQISQTTDATYSCAGTNIGMAIVHSSHQFDDFGGGTLRIPFMTILEFK